MRIAIVVFKKKIVIFIFKMKLGHKICARIERNIALFVVKIFESRYYQKVG